MDENKKLRDQAFDFDDVDWDEYESHRPPYSETLYDIIFDHHRRNRGQWQAALDVGAGGGVVTRTLLGDFKHVYFSDPSDEYVAQAQSKFAKDVSLGRITILRRKFDEFKPEDDLPKDGVDMITAGTCIHFGSAAHLMAQLGPLLRSGGTVAAFGYGSSPIVDPSERAGQLINKIKDKIMRWIHDNVTPCDKVESTGTGQARYNNVDFDPATWINVRRIHSLLEKPWWPSWIEPAESRVRDTEAVEIVSDDFLARQVDYDFFVGYYRNFAPGLDILGLIPDELDELRLAMDGRSILVKWPLALTLATKK